MESDGVTTRNYIYTVIERVFSYELPHGCEGYEIGTNLTMELPVWVGIALKSWVFYYSVIPLVLLNEFKI